LSREPVRKRAIDYVLVGNNITVEPLLVTLQFRVWTSISYR
jgi:hypothetical protein